jgi:hypothetical protein
LLSAVFKAVCEFPLTCYFQPHLSARF